MTSAGVASGFRFRTRFTYLRAIACRALTAFAINLIVVVVLTLVFRALKVPDGVDSTHASDYRADQGDPGVKDLPELLDEGGASPSKS